MFHHLQFANYNVKLKLILTMYQYIPYRKTKKRNLHRILQLRSFLIQMDLNGRSCLMKLAIKTQVWPKRSFQ